MACEAAMVFKEEMRCERDSFLSACFDVSNFEEGTHAAALVTPCTHN